VLAQGISKPGKTVILKTVSSLGLAIALQTVGGFESTPHTLIPTKTLRHNITTMFTLTNIKRVPDDHEITYTADLMLNDELISNTELYPYGGISSCAMPVSDEAFEKARTELSKDKYPEKYQQVSTWNDKNLPYLGAIATRLLQEQI
jgi:hypothetical protein